MQRRVVDFEVTPRADAEVDEATRSVLLTGLSQLRHKFCSEVAALEELLGTAACTSSDPLLVMMTPASPTLPSSSRGLPVPTPETRAAPILREMLGLPIAPRGDSSNDWRPRPRPRLAVDLNGDPEEAADDSPKVNEKVVAAPALRPRARSAGSGMPSDWQTPRTRRHKTTMSPCSAPLAPMAPSESGVTPRNARSQQTDVYDMITALSSNSHSLAFSERYVSEKMDELAENAGVGTSSTDARGSPGAASSNAVGSFAGGPDAASSDAAGSPGVTQDDAIQRSASSAASGLSGISMGYADFAAQLGHHRSPRVCSVLTKHDRAARSRADVLARRKRTVLEASGRDKRPSTSMIGDMCRRLTHSRCFEAFFAFMILSNSAILAAEVQFTAANIGKSQLLCFELAGYFYNLMFLFELICRILAEGLRAYYFSPESRFWAMMDTLVVVTSLIDGVQGYISLHVEGHTDSQTVDASNLRIMRIMRMVRVLRSFRAFRLIRIMTNLQTLVVSILATLRSIIWAALLLIFVMYVFGVTFTDCYCDGAVFADEMDDLTILVTYWGSLGKSMDSLFQAVANGISWRESYEALYEVSPICGVLYICFLSFTYFVLLNVITGVFCNAAIESAQKNPELVLQSTSNEIDNIKKLFGAVDATGSGSITIAEFETLLGDELTKAHFRAVGLDINDAWTIFKLMDEDKNGSISESEFVAGIEALKGGAKNVDLTALRTEVRIANRKMLEKLEAVTSRAPASIAHAGDPSHLSAEYTAARVPQRDEVEV